MSTPGNYAQTDPAQSVQPHKDCTDGAGTASSDHSKPPSIVPPAIMPPEVHIDATLEQEHALDVPLPDSPDGLSTPGSPPITSGTTSGPALKPGTGLKPGTAEPPQTTSGTASGPTPKPGTDIKTGTTSPDHSTASGPNPGTGLKTGTADQNPGQTSTSTASGLSGKPGTGSSPGPSSTGHASGTASGPNEKTGTGSNPGKTPSTPHTPGKLEGNPFFLLGSPDAHSSPLKTTRRTLFTTPSRSGKKRPASPTSPDLSGQVGDTPSKKVCRNSSVKKTTARQKLFDPTAPGHTATSSFEEPMETAPAPSSSTTLADTFVSITFSLITGTMTQHMRERITKAFRNYLGNGYQSAPTIGNRSVTFTIRNALLTKASHFVNQSLGLPDLRFTTSNQKQTRNSRNTTNTSQHSSKGIINTHLSKAEFAKKFNMTSNNITDFKPITNRTGTKQAILTFSTNIAPLHITSDTTQIEVSPLLLAVHRCYKCQHFGHTHAKCRKLYTRCMFCSRDHASGICMELKAPHPCLICPNCNFQGHAAGNQFCPALRDYKAKIATMNQQIMSDWEARKSAAKQTPTNTPASPPKPMQATYAQATGATILPKQTHSEQANASTTSLVLPPVDKDQNQVLVTKHHLASILKCILTPNTLSQLQTMTEAQREETIDAVVYSTNAFALNNQADQVITIDDDTETATSQHTTTQPPSTQNTTAQPTTPPLKKILKLTGIDKLSTPNPSPNKHESSSNTVQNKSTKHAQTKSPRSNNINRRGTGGKRLVNKPSPDAPFTGPPPHRRAQKPLDRRLTLLQNPNIF